MGTLNFAQITKLFLKTIWFMYFSFRHEKQFRCIFFTNAKFKGLFYKVLLMLATN